MIETDVLIVGSGPAGSSAAALLSSYGIANVLVTKYRWLADTPRAHITNQRTMEVLRDLGLEDEAMARATPNRLMGETVFCTSLVGEELGRLRSWGTAPMSHARHRMASPTEMVDLPQTLLEPILFSAACARGTRARLSTEYLSLEQDDDGVTATVRDRVSGEIYPIRAKYLIGADGGRSKVAEDIGLPMEGQMGVAGSMNICFTADLSRYVAYRPSVLYWVLQPGSNVGGIGMGLVRMVRPWTEWLIVWGYDINSKPPAVTDDLGRDVVHSLVGDDSIDVDITSVSTWTVNHMHAHAYSSGRVFCAGDAVHRHPPSNGLGSNTSIQDAFNLAWKLAMVLKGQAGKELLATYDAERAPIGRQIVDRANKSIGEFGPIFSALGLDDAKSAQTMIDTMARRKDAAGQAQRDALRAALAGKVYEFDAHGVEMNHRYRSSAVIGADGEAQFEEDRELIHAPSTEPGARIPHAVLAKGDKTVSSLDLIGRGQFALLTGVGGGRWREAAKEAMESLGLDVAVTIIGPGGDWEDVYGDWAAQWSDCDAGALLVRPDQVVGWRGSESDTAGDLVNALAAILHRTP